MSTDWVRKARRSAEDGQEGVSGFGFKFTSNTNGIGDDLRRRAQFEKMTVTNFELFIKLHSLGVNAKILVAQGGEDGYGTSRRDGISGDLLYRKCKRYCRLG